MICWWRSNQPDNGRMRRAWRTGDWARRWRSCYWNHLLPERHHSLGTLLSLSLLSANIVNRIAQIVIVRHAGLSKMKPEGVGSIPTGASNLWLHGPAARASGQSLIVIVNAIIAWGNTGDGPYGRYARRPAFLES